jgi:hypothetical protein
MAQPTTTLTNPTSALPLSKRGAASDSGCYQATGPRTSLYLNDIRQLAYQKWVAAGRPEGDSSRFWLEAEQELLQGAESVPTSMSG